MAVNFNNTPLIESCTNTKKVSPILSTGKFTLYCYEQ